MEQQDLAETRTKIMKSRGSQDPYVQEAILSVTDINCQIIQLQIRINELFRFPCTAPYLLLPLDQREESVMKNCIERQGSLYLLLDYEPTLEDEGYSCNSLDWTIPYIPHDLMDPGTEQLKLSSAYKQESTKPSAQVEPSDPKEATCTQNEDSHMGSLQENEIGLLKNDNRTIFLRLLRRKKKTAVLLFTRKSQTTNPNPNPKSVSNPKH